MITCREEKRGMESRLLKFVTRRRGLEVYGGGWVVLVFIFYPVGRPSGCFSYSGI